jgi:sugar transferase (PEP-CTERM/EpsH1 system associated)
MRVLWVKSGGLVPLDHGGRIRSYQLAKVLSQTHEVSLFTFYTPTPDDQHSALTDVFTRVECIPISVPAQAGIGECLAYGANLLSSRPYSVSKYCQKHVSRRLRKHLTENSYDLIICDFLLTAGVIPWDLPGPRVVFTHNVEAQIWQRQFEVARNPIWKAVCYREYKTTDQMERKYLRKADHVLTVSETDRDFFSSYMDRSKLSVVPTGVDIEYYQPVDEAEQLNTIVFTGSMDWLANEDGVIYFAERILPLVRQEFPDAAFWVVGRRPSEKLKSFAENVPAMKVTGTVPDVRPYIAKGAVYVVPLFVGGGTRLKIYEAMAMGKAVVSTSIGAEGLPVTSQKNIVLADDPAEFAREVVGLLRNPEKRRTLGRAARELVEQSYSWDSVGQELGRILNRVAESCGHKRLTNT